MKQLKRSGIYKATNVTFDPATIDAYSYGWWRFVAVVEGKVIFNNYRYSNTTAKHQYKVRTLLAELGIKIDMELPLRKGIDYRPLAELILEAEEYLCDEILENEMKREERNLKAKHRRHAKRLEAYLENQCAFRDYEIKQARQFGKVNKIAVHQLVEIETLESDVQNALHNFHRDGFGTVVFYI